MLLGFTAVDAKIREARHNLARLPPITSVKEFYPAVNAFLASARGVLSVLCYQFGHDELTKTPKDKILLGTLSAADVAERKRFDAWFKREAKPFVKHPLKEERDEAMHRSGQAGFKYYPKPGPGLALHPGGPFATARVAYGGGRVGLPLEDNNVFVYEHPGGIRVDAFTYCQEFLDEIEALVGKARSQPWR